MLSRISPVLTRGTELGPHQYYPYTFTRALEEFLLNGPNVTISQAGI